MMADVGHLFPSNDGTKIWAEAVGDASKPCIVWIHGLSCSALPFDKQFSDPDFLENYYMVRPLLRYFSRMPISHLSHYDADIWTMWYDVV